MREVFVRNLGLFWLLLWSLIYQEGEYTKRYYIHIRRSQIPSRNQLGAILISYWVAFKIMIGSRNMPLSCSHSLIGNAQGIEIALVEFLKSFRAGCLFVYSNSDIPCNWSLLAIMLWLLQFDLQEE